MVPYHIATRVVDATSHSYKGIDFPVYCSGDAIRRRGEASGG